MSTRFGKELESFQDLWEGGFYEGDPLDPIGKSNYKQLSYISVLHATYLRCIRPYINNQTNALEIGPGRGAWTKTMLLSKHIVALDALPEEHNKFFEYLGNPQNVQYHQVKDFDCRMLPDSYFTYMFSFGCLCHVSFEGISQYAANLFPKLKAGSNCFWMIADYEKYNRALRDITKLSYFNIPFQRRRYSFLRACVRGIIGRTALPMRDLTEDDEPRPGRWYNAGIERTCFMLRNVGYRIIDPDVGTILRDPIIHFVKPRVEAEEQRLFES
jgi:hypothetical protein